MMSALPVASAAGPIGNEAPRPATRIVCCPEKQPFVYTQPPAAGETRVLALLGARERSEIGS